MVNQHFKVNLIHVLGTVLYADYVCSLNLNQIIPKLENIFNYLWSHDICNICMFALKVNYSELCKGLNDRPSAGPMQCCRSTKLVVKDVLIAHRTLSTEQLGCMLGSSVHNLENLTANHISAPCWGKCHVPYT